MRPPLSVDYLTHILEDARTRTLELIVDLDGEKLMGPRLEVVNPLLWEIGHLAWFHEIFILRRLDGRDPCFEHADSLYDSATVAHDTRWDLPLPTLEATLEYMELVEEALIARLDGPIASEQDSYFYQLTTYHEDMHGEAFTYSRQTLGYPRPRFTAAASAPPQDADAGPLPGVDKSRVVVGLLGDELLILTLENRVEIAARRLFDQVDQLFDPQHSVEAHPQAHQTALVVSPAGADLLRARA